jgi:hypothetical protein
MSDLGSILRETAEEYGVSIDELTVMDWATDPFRRDIPSAHTNGRWLRDQMRRLGLLDRTAPIHLRGLHYALVADGNVMLPDADMSRRGPKKTRAGQPYTNDEYCWRFLVEDAAKAARWLGYVPFEKIVDAKNAEPVIREAQVLDPVAWVHIGASTQMPDAADLEPRPALVRFRGRQHYHLVFWGEKTSLEEVLGPLAEQYEADLYLPSGEISDTLLARMAKRGAEDGRPMVVLVFADCDPSGYQMAVSIAHKLRAMRELLYPSLEFRVIAPALTVDQVGDLNLPSTPLKETEMRAAGWRDKHGVEQTEIDALATLRPDVLRDIAHGAVEPYFDGTLAERVEEASDEWLEEAQERLEEADYELELDAARAALDDFRSAVRALEAAASVVLPPLPDVPEPDVDEPGEVLIDSDMDLYEHIEILKDRKNYSNGA